MCFYVIYTELNAFYIYRQLASVRVEGTPNIWETCKRAGHYGIHVIIGHWSLRRTDSSVARVWAAIQLVSGLRSLPFPFPFPPTFPFLSFLFSSVLSCPGTISHLPFPHLHSPEIQLVQRSLTTHALKSLHGTNVRIHCRLDYCNAVLAGTARIQTKRLQSQGCMKQIESGGPKFFLGPHFSFGPPNTKDKWGPKNGSSADE